MLAIIGAMDEEIALLLQYLKERQDHPVLGGTLHQGVLDSLPVLLCKCGIGKVNAALSTAALIGAGATQLIFTGVAGGAQPELRVGDIVVSTDLVQADVDVTPLGYALGTIPSEAPSWAADAALQALALQVARQVRDEQGQAVQVQAGRIASGDQFVASAAGVQHIRDTFGAACVEMEGAAVAQVCHKVGLPFVVIRSISDTADHDANVNYQEFMPKMADRAAQVVRQMVAELRAQS